MTTPTLNRSTGMRCPGCCVRKGEHPEPCVPGCKALSIKEVSLPPAPADLLEVLADVQRERAAAPVPAISTDTGLPLVAHQPAPAIPVDQQMARWVINGAILKGRLGEKAPPEPWLFEYWQLGLQVSTLGDCIGEQQQSLIAAARMRHEQATAPAPQPGARGAIVSQLQILRGGLTAETKEEFIAAYCANHNRPGHVATPEYLAKYKVILPCNCEEAGGPWHWAVVSNDPYLVRTHNLFYNPAPAEISLESILCRLRADRDNATDGVRGAYNDACDRLEVLISKIAEASTEPATWKPITAPGQVKVGDKLRFNIGDEKFSETIKLIIHKGTPDEEIIYNKSRNFYLITSMCIKGTGQSKNVEFLATSSAAKGTT
jgi:hypothetical protein